MTKTDALKWLENITYEDFERLSHKQRMDVIRIYLPGPLEKLTPEQATSIGNLIELILESTPYPAREQIRDRRIAEDFLERWKTMRASGVLDTPILQAHLGDTGPFIEHVAHAAMRSMGLVPGLITVHTAEKSLHEFNADVTDEHDFTALAHVRCELDDATKQLNVYITVNGEAPLLQEIHPDNEDAIVDLAAMMLHEISHVEEYVALIHRESIDTMLTADWMLTQRLHVGDYAYRHDIYRSLLSERQAYNRQHLFTDMYHNRPISAEISYCWGDKNSHIARSDHKSGQEKAYPQRWDEPMRSASYKNAPRSCPS